MDASAHHIIDIETDDNAKPGRRGDGGTYLIVADESDEFDIALRYAARTADARRGHIGIVHVLDIEDFQHWGTVESQMRKEMREQAEKFVWGVAKKINDLTGQTPSIYLEEGKRNDALIDVINRDTMIVKLVLGASAGAGGPGPMVSYFTGKGMNRLRVPVVLVPGHLEPLAIDDLT
jgi:nucleotide-binding universal stress UspA family protein